MKNRFFTKVCLIVFCVVTLLVMVGCREKQDETDSQIKDIYRLAQQNGETRTYEDWLSSIKGERGAKGDNIELRVRDGYIQWKTTSDTKWTNLISVNELKGYDGRDGKDGTNADIWTIGEDGFWYQNGNKTNYRAKGEDATYSTYTITFDDKYAIAFSDFVSQVTIKSTEWIKNLPSIQEFYKDKFLGWYIIGTNKKIDNYDFIGESVTLEPKFTEELSGYYKDNKMVNTWTELKELYPYVFTEDSMYGVEDHFLYNDGYRDVYALGTYISDLNGVLVIDESIKYIDRYAFNECYKLEGLILPETFDIDLVGHSFKNLKFNVYENGNYIGSQKNPYMILYNVIDENEKTLKVHEDCQYIRIVDNEALEDIILPNNLKYIAVWAFSTCKNLKYNVYENDKYLGNSDNPYMVLMKVSDFSETYEIKDGCKIVYSFAFGDCDMTTLIIPESIEFIGSSSFSYNNGNNLTNVYYKGTIEEWQNIVFEEGFYFTGHPMYYADNLYFLNKDGEWYEPTEIVIDEDMTIIPKEAYCGFTKAESVTIGDNITKIDEYAFLGCKNLKNVTISKSVKEIEEGAFCGCDNLENVYYTGTIEDWIKINMLSQDSNPMNYASHFYVYENNNWVEVTKLHIDEVRGYNLYGFSNVETVFLSSNVKEIHGNFTERIESTDYLRGLFYKYDSLVNVYYDGSLEEWCNIDFRTCYDNPMSKSKNFCLMVSGLNLKLVEITIPNTISEIKDYTFYGNEDLKKVILPQGLKSIGAEAFANCPNLINISIPSSLEKITNNPFKISDNIAYTEYENGLYLGNDENPYLILMDFKPSFNTEAIIHENCKFIVRGALFNIIQVKSIIIPNGVKALEYCLLYYSKTENIVIGSGVTEIGSDCFEGSDLINVYYYGTEENFNKIKVYDKSRAYEKANKYFYSESQPSIEGNYWHYVEGVPTVWNVEE